MHHVAKIQRYFFNNYITDCQGFNNVTVEITEKVRCINASNLQEKLYNPFDYTDYIVGMTFANCMVWGYKT